MYQFRFDWLDKYATMLADGALWTLILTAIACTAGSAIGLSVAVGGSTRFAPIRWLAAVYVEAIRNTPLLAQAFLIYFGLANLGLRLTPMTAGCLALTVNCGAYTAEIFRAGFGSVNRAQREAAACLGLGPIDSFVSVVLPQALRNIWLPLSGQFVLILLASSILSQISADELTAAANQVQALTFRSFEVYGVVALIYLGLALGLKAALTVVGRRWLHTRRRKNGRLSAVRSGMA